MRSHATFVYKVTILCVFIVLLLQFYEDKQKLLLFFICTSLFMCHLCKVNYKNRDFLYSKCAGANHNKWIRNSEKNGCTSEGLYDYKLLIMTAWVQLNAPVWVSYKQKQREPIIRCRRLQGRVPVAQPEPVWEVLRLTGEVQRKHAAGQALPGSPLFNLITVMSLETVGCTTSNVDADKHTALTHSLRSRWQPNGKRIIRLKPSIARWLIDHGNR